MEAIGNISEKARASMPFQPAATALLMIDMQLGFIDPASSLCIAGAAGTIGACRQMLDIARAASIPVIHVRREYAADGSDVEPVRRQIWEDGGRPLSSAWPESLLPPKKLEPLKGEEILIKPNFSAFFGTDLHDRLQREGVKSLILIGTTTPNCIRSTCYDALSHGYDVAVVSDATSSRTPEVQQANLADMDFIGATVCSVEELEGLMKH